MSEANKQVVRRWFDEVWNQGLEETIDDLFAADGIAHGLGDTEADVHGPAEFKTFARNIRGTLPDVNIEIKRMIAEGDFVAVHIVLEGTHSGGRLHEPPTGRRVRIAGIIMVRIANGQIVEAWNSYDQLGLLRQTGALPDQDLGTPKIDTFLTPRA